MARSCRSQVRFLVDNHQHCRSRTAESRSQNPVLTYKRKEWRQLRADGSAIGLVNAVAHGDAQQIGPGLGKSQTEDGDGLKIRDDVRQFRNWPAAPPAPWWWKAAQQEAQRWLATQWEGRPEPRRRNGPHTRQQQTRPTSRRPRYQDGLRARTLLRECDRSPNQAARNERLGRWLQDARLPRSRSPFQEEFRLPCEGPKERWDGHSHGAVSCRFRE